MEASKVLSQREVILIPDLGGEENWNKKMIMLQPICKRVTMSRWLTNNATEEQRRQGLDIADSLIAAALKKSPFDHKGCTDQELFDHWKETIPGFRELADKLELECVTPYRRGS